MSMCSVLKKQMVYLMLYQSLAFFCLDVRCSLLRVACTFTLILKTKKAKIKVNLQRKEYRSQMCSSRKNVNEIAIAHGDMLAYATRFYDAWMILASQFVGSVLFASKNTVLIHS